MKTEMTIEDARLAARLAQTLDQAAQAEDPAWDARVEQILRMTAKPAPKHHGWHLSAGLALAASVAFVAVIPSSWIRGGASGTAPIAVDAQMAEEIDWLLDMDEASRGH